MSLDVYLEAMQPTEVFSANITHNLARMASEFGLYTALWAPDLIEATKARDLIPALADGLSALRANEDRAREFDDPAGWGRYEHLVKFVASYLQACKDNPEAGIRVSR